MDNLGVFGAVILFIIIRVLFNVFAGKNNSSKKQQAIEEQKRRRQAYETARDQDMPKRTTAQTVMSEIANAMDELEIDIPGRRRQSSSAEQPQPVSMPKTLVRGFPNSIPIVKDTVVSRPDAVSPGLSNPTKSPSTTAYATDSTPWVADTLDEIYPNRHAFTKNDLKRGIIMAEVLGPCRAKAKRV